MFGYFSSNDKTVPKCHAYTTLFLLMKKKTHKNKKQKTNTMKPIQFKKYNEADENWFSCPQSPNFKTVLKRLHNYTWKQQQRKGSSS